MKEDVLETVRRLGHGLVDTAQNRLRLLQAELADELDRFGALLARQILVALSALLTIQFLALLVLAVSWDTAWRIPAMVVLTLLAVVATALSYRAYLKRTQRATPIFAASLEALAADRRTLEKTS